jgi:hypothetical protein
MGKLLGDAIEHLKEIAWAVFMLFLFLAALALLFGGHAGYVTVVLVCLGFASLVAIVFGSIFVINLIWIGAIRILRIIGRRRDYFQSQNHAYRRVVKLGARIKWQSRWPALPRRQKDRMSVLLLNQLEYKQEHPLQNVLDVIKGDAIRRL